MTDLLKLLRNDIRFNPFSKKFDIRYVNQFLIEQEHRISDMDSINKAKSTGVFNKYFMLFKQKVDELNLKYKSSNSLLKAILITIVNQDYHNVSRKLDNLFNERKTIILDDVLNFKIESRIPEFGEIDPQGALEAIHDGMNYILNFWVDIENQKDNDIFEDEQVNYCISVLSLSNQYSVIKYAYDTAIWQGFKLNLSYNPFQINIFGSEDNVQLINKIGEARLENNLSSKCLMALKISNSDNKYKEIISQEQNRKRKGKRLKSIQIINGKVSYKLADGIEKNATKNELIKFVEMTSFNEYVKNIQLPKLEGLHLHDILTIFSEIQYLFQEVSLIQKNETKEDAFNHSLYKCSISKTDLENYVFSKTNYSKHQIKKAMDVFVHEFEYANIWETPLIKIGEQIFPILMPLISPNMLRMEDYWLEAGGFDLDQRGKLFETYIKNEIKSALFEKKFFCKILGTNVFINSEREEQEIDLILELKTRIVVAEIKCIKFPFGPRDYFNMNKKLNEGAEQVKKKTKFLIENMSDFAKEIDYSKEILSVVITNYPFFSGQIINDVPVVDQLLLKNYFLRGSLNNTLLHFNLKSNDFDDDNNGINYYSNEDEFCERLKSFLYKPAPIEAKKNSFFTTEKQISLPGSVPKIIMSYPNIKDGFET